MNRSLLLSFLFILTFMVTEYALGAQPYQPLVGLPQLEGSGESDGNLVPYFNRLYMVTVAIGAILGFLKISMAGVKYSLTEIVTDKSDAKKDIQGALLGLLILLIPYVVLNTIYPNLTNLDVLKEGRPINLGTSSKPPTTEQRIVTQCSPKADGSTPSGCPSNVSVNDLTVANQCNGYYDFNAKECFTKNSSKTYNTNAGGDWGSLTHDGWRKLCGCSDSSDDRTCLNDTGTGNQRTYSCKSATINCTDGRTSC